MELTHDVERVSEVLTEPEGVVDRRVDVAAGDGVADAEQLEAARRVGVDLLRQPVDERVMIQLAEVDRRRHEVVVQPIVGENTVVAHDCVDDSFVSYG